MKAGSLTLGLLVLGLLTGPLACSDDDHDHGDDAEHEHEEIPASCEEFHDDCVKISETNAKAKECDEFSHAEGRTEAECAAKKDECIAACRP